MVKKTENGSHMLLCVMTTGLKTTLC